MKPPAPVPVVVIALVILAALSFIPVGADLVPEVFDPARVGGPGAVYSGAPVELSKYNPAPVVIEGESATIPLLFIHHSSGGQLFARKGQEVGDSCIYDSHPNGGGLRSRLRKLGYEIHEASYGSVIGQDTDLFHWLPKFRDQMDRVLRTKEQDETYPEGTGQGNRIVMFKSCYPNNHFVGEGEEPGDPRGPDLTLANAKATLAHLLPEFAKQPKVLFVYVTAPALAPVVPRDRAWKALAKLALGKPSNVERALEEAALARRFHDWARSREGWLKGYPLKNVVVFDYYDILTGRGRSNLSVFGSAAGRDSHPSSEGNRLAADAFVPFLNQAVRRLGMAR